MGRAPGDAKVLRPVGEGGGGQTVTISKSVQMRRELNSLHE